MKVSDVFNSAKSLNVKDLKGNRVPVTIREVTLKKFDDGSKLIMTFHNAEKALILNKTNSNMIAEIVGSEDTDYWPGKRIVLIPAKTDFQGKRVDCIRVDYPEQNGHAEPVKPKPVAVLDTPFPDDPPF